MMSKDSDKSTMTCVDAEMRRWARELEDGEMRRTGKQRPFARQALADRIGVASGTLENIQRGRSKGLRRWIEDKIAAAVAHEVELEISRLERTLEEARRRLGRSAATEIGEAEAAIENARDKLAKIKG